MIFFYKKQKKLLQFITKCYISIITNEKLGCRQVVRQRFLIPSFVAQIPTTQPTKKPPQGRFFYWLGWLDSNQRMPVSKTGALPLGDSPILLGICIYILFFQNMQVFFKKIIIFIIFYKMYTEHINLFLCPLFVTNSYIFDITIHLTLF